MIICKQLTKEYHKGDNVIRPLHNLDLEIQAGRFLARDNVHAAMEAMLGSVPTAHEEISEVKAAQ